VANAQLDESTEYPKGAVRESTGSEDLAGSRAGRMAREQARLAKEAAPVRTVLARLIRVHTEERAWRLGAQGEELVGNQLARVVAKDPRWRVLHAIPVGNKGADIDHLIVGPAGVFTLNTKHHPGARIWVAGDSLRVNGVHQPYIRNSRHEATRAGRLRSQACGLPVVATGVVVPVNADDIAVKRAPDDVYVINRWRLRRWLCRRPQVLDEPTADRIHQMARRADTWTA
jgi:hypothetical protein